MTSRARYLIIKLGALGDVVMASTLIGAIRARDPDAHVTWLCGAQVADLVGLFDGVDAMIVADDAGLLRGGILARGRAMLAVWRRVLAQRFNMTLLAHADARYRALLPLRPGKVRTLGTQRDARRLPVVGRWFGDEYARMLDEDLSRGPIVGHASLAGLRAGREPVALPSPVGVVLVPGGARNVLRESALRRWPVERYRAVAEGLLAAGHAVTLVGDASDAWVRPTFDGLEVHDEIGAQSVPGTLALLERARLVITHDTGPLHLAALARVPILALFGPTIPEQFLLPQRGAEAIWGGADLACRPCYDGREFAACRNNLCMQDITIDRVLARARAVLDGAPAATPVAIFRP
jgi:ADP-heptose:LPS heptosyltransferase